MNNNMYLYFDSNGYLKEFITCPARAGSENVNSIYFYVEPALESDRNKVDGNGDAYYALPNNLDHGVLTFKLHDVLDGVTDENGVALNSLAFTSANFRIEDIQPFNKKRDLLFFKWFQKYQFVKVDLTSDILLNAGNVECTIGCYNASNTKVYNLDLFSFYVADSAVQSANYVTTSQYHMLLALMKSGLSSAVSRYNVLSSDTLADIYDLIGTQISVLNIDDKEYLVEMSSSGSIVLYDLYNREWYAYEGSDTTAIDDVTRYLYRYHIATKEYVDMQDNSIKNYVDTQDNSLKTYVDTQDATKLDKVNTSDTKERVYGITQAGGQTTYSVGSGANDIVKRDNNGQIQVPMNPSSSLDAVSKSYVDSKFSALGSALIYMGSKTVAQLNALTNIEKGDLYNVSDSGTLTQGNVRVNAGDNVAWDGSEWDKLSSDIDLSAYYNKNETDALLDEKQDTLVSGTNIKSINNQSLLGSGDITIQAGAIEKTGAELEDMTYVEGQLYYCTSSSESFSADTLYMATGENTIVRFTQTTVNTNPAITSFSVSPTTTEYGNTRNCTYTYTLKKYSALSNISLDGTIIAAAPSSASGSGTAATAYDSHTFTLSATYSGITVSKTANITAQYRQFYGVVSGDTVAQVLTNLKDVQTDTSSLKTVLSNSLPSSVSLSLGSTPVYVYFIVRSNLTINTLKSGGFDVPFSLVDTQSFTNHYDASYTVKVYRTDNKVFGDMVVNINL